MLNKIILIDFCVYVCVCVGKVHEDWFHADKRATKYFQFMQICGKVIHIFNYMFSYISIHFNVRHLNVNCTLEPISIPTKWFNIVGLSNLI